MKMLSQLITELLIMKNRHGDHPITMMDDFDGGDGEVFVGDIDFNEPKGLCVYPPHFTVEYGPQVPKEWHR